MAKRLSEERIKDLNSKINKISPIKIVEYIEAGIVSLQDLVELRGERRETVIRLLTPEPVFTPTQAEPAPEPVVEIEEPKVEPLAEDSTDSLKEQREQEFGKMAAESGNYPLERLKNLLESGVFTRQELIEKGLASEFSLSVTDNYDEIKESLPDLFDAIESCRKECALGRTDVFLFGIPSTGKSCILMGLMGSSKIDINFVKAGGPYAGVLYQYLRNGITINQTPSKFVATFESTIISPYGYKYLNLVEMSGEDFATAIANNPNAVTNFDQMGGDAAQLLSGPNKKVIFMIIDPTAKTVSFNQTYHKTDAQGNYLYDNQGNPIQATKRIVVDQYVTLRRMIDMFALPANARVMMNVDYIHFILTKADLLAPRNEREKVAYDNFMQNYRSLLDPFILMCRKYGINQSSNPQMNGVPNLYTFSLGHFYPGGIVEYDPTDSDKFVSILDSLCQPAY